MEPTPSPTSDFSDKMLAYRLSDCDVSDVMDDVLSDDLVSR